MDFKVDTLHQVIYLCFILQNYCDNMKENLPDQNLMSALSFEKSAQPSTSSLSYGERVNENNAISISNSLTLYFEGFLIITRLRHLSRQNVCLQFSFSFLEAYLTLHLTLCSVYFTLTQEC